MAAQAAVDGGSRTGWLAGSFQAQCTKCMGEIQRGECMLAFWLRSVKVAWVGICLWEVLKLTTGKEEKILCNQMNKVFIL